MLIIVSQKRPVSRRRDTPRHYNRTSQFFGRLLHKPRMPKIFAVHRTGFRIELDDIDRNRLDEAIAWLIAHDYRPDGSGDSWPKTPSGLPICTKHNTEMRQRQKQGDSWFSHRVIDHQTGEERFCKGFRNPSNPSDGFDL